MPATRVPVLVALCWLVVSGCSEPAPSPTQERIYAMGTWVDVTLVGGPGLDSNPISADIERLLRTFERDYYPWAQGELAGLNHRISAGLGTKVGAELADLLQRAQMLSLASDGLFEPGIGKLVELWGFHATTHDERSPPPDSAIDATLATSAGIAALTIDGSEVSSGSREVFIDLGGVAKGAAVEKITALLETRGISSALVNAGGDLAVVGHAPDDRPWRIGIRHPRQDGLLGLLELADGEAAFTSGDYERFYDFRGERLHHLLDPSSGRPVTHTQAVTVIARDAVLADAGATAIFVAGPTRWREIAARLGLEAVLRVDASGTVEMTPSMANRVTSPDVAHDSMMGTR